MGNHIRDSGGIFFISSLVKTSNTSLISCLTYHNLPYIWSGMIETSSDLPRKSSAILGNLRQIFGNVRVAIWHFLEILENLRKVTVNLRRIIKDVINMLFLQQAKYCMVVCISSRVQLYISLARCAHLWDIELNTRRYIHAISKRAKVFSSLLSLMIIAYNNV